EAAFEVMFQRVPIFLGFLGVARAGLAYAFGDYTGAWRSAQQATASFAGSAEQIWHSVLDLFHGMTAAALYPHAPASERAALLAAIDASCRALELRSTGCRENFEHQFLLLSAERARVLDEGERAAELYAGAAAAAERAGYLNDRALVRERAALFCSGRGDLDA